MPLRQFATLGGFALLTIIAAESSGQEDPFGGAVDPFGAGEVDPFAPDADPFRGGADPFAPTRKFDPAEAARRAAQREKQWRRQHQQELVGRAYLLFSQRYLEPGVDDRKRLDAGLALLHFLLNDETTLPGELLDIISRLAQSNWSLDTKDESPDTMAKRLTNARAEYDEFVPERCFVGLNIPRLRARYEENSDAPWPLGWRVREAFFVEFTESFFTSLQADDPASVWKQRIVDDQENAKLYTAAYLGVLRGRQAEGVDTAIISRYVTNAEGAAQRVQRLAQSLASVAAARDDVDDFAQRRLREKLLEEIQISQPNEVDSIEALASIAEFGDPTTEVEPIMQELLKYDSPRWFSNFCFRTKIGRRTQTNWYLRKQVRVNVQQRPAREALSLLKSKVEMPLWFDESIKADTHLIDVDIDGPWLDALRAVTREAKLEIVPLEGDVLWIVPSEQREQARQRLRASLSKIPLGDRYVAEALKHETHIEFFETPVTDVCDYLKDLHAVEIVTPWEFDGDAVPDITADLKALPLCLALTLILDDVDLTWDAAEDVIAVGPPDFVTNFNMAAVETRVKRLLRAHQESATSSALDDLTTMEFIETPLVDITDYMSDLHGVPVLCIDRDISDQAITKNLKGMPLDWGLSLVVFDQKLDWFADEYAIYVGLTESIDSHKRRAETRKQRRGKHRMLLGDKLQQPVKLEFIETPLSRVVSEMSKLTGMTIKLEAASDGIESTLVTATQYHKLPVDVHLDLITVDLDLFWNIGEDGEIVVSNRKNSP